MLFGGCNFDLTNAFLVRCSTISNCCQTYYKHDTASDALVSLVAIAVCRTQDLTSHKPSSVETALIRGHSWVGSDLIDKPCML